MCTCWLISLLFTPSGEYFVPWDTSVLKVYGMADVAFYNASFKRRSGYEMNFLLNTRSYIATMGRG